MHFKSSFSLSESFALSSLFRIWISFLSLRFIPFNISCFDFSHSSSFSEISEITRINIAFSIALKERSIPCFSISFLLSLIPAVSIKRYSTPLIKKRSSIVSMVVPAILDTITLSSFSIAFIRVLLPLFGFPTIATGIPCLKALACLKESQSSVKRSWVSFSSCRSFSLSTNISCSSEKSISNSNREATFKNFSLSESNISL